MLWTTGDSSASLSRELPPSVDCDFPGILGAMTQFAVGVSTDLRKVSIDLHTEAFCTSMHSMPTSSPFSKVKPVMGTPEDSCLAWSSYDCFHPFLSKTDVEF